MLSSPSHVHDWSIQEVREMVLEKEMVLLRAMMLWREVGLWTKKSLQVAEYEAAAVDD
jgi:hypothetical protein